MKRLAPGFVVLCLLGLTGPAAAATATKIAPEPAATLLLPYFEVNLDDPNGMDTLLSVNNASDQAVLAHVVVWSDLSVPVLDFNIYLTGYDVQTINLRDIPVSRLIPRTASVGQDPSDTISPQGSFSQDVNFTSCAGLLPTPTLPASFVVGLQASLTGRASSNFAGRCGSRFFGDNVARGYITVDTVNSCTLLFPGDPGYFATDGSRIATDQNVLWGDYSYIDNSTGTAEGNTLVHIVAEEPPPSPEELPSSLVNHPYTFYGRYVGWSGADKRRPLATNFAVRYINTEEQGTSLIVWRDSKVKQIPFTCPVIPGSQPSWYPLGQEGLVLFDEQEYPDVPLSFSTSPQPPQGFAPFAGEAQRVVMGGPDFPLLFNFGWLYLNLNTSVFRVTEPSDTAAAQAWVAVTMNYGGTFSVGFDAVQIDNASRALHQTPGPP